MARQENDRKSKQRFLDDHQRVRTRTRWMKSLNRVACFVFILAICSAVFVTALPQRKKLTGLEKELEEVQLVERSARERKDFEQRKYQALEEGMGYKETEARDRLDLYIPGETIFRFPRVN